MSNEKEYAFVHVSPKCVTHFEGCACQQEKVRQLEAEVTRLNECSRGRKACDVIIGELEAECERLRGEAVLQQIHYSDKLKEQRDTLGAQNEKLMAVVDAPKDNGMARELLSFLKATYGLLRPVLSLAVNSRADFERVKSAIEKAVANADRALGPETPPATPYECEHL